MCADVVPVVDDEGRVEAMDNSSLAAWYAGTRLEHFISTTDSYVQAAILIAYIMLASTAAAIGFHGVYKVILQGRYPAHHNPDMFPIVIRSDYQPLSGYTSNSHSSIQSSTSCPWSSLCSVSIRREIGRTTCAKSCRSMPTCSEHYEPVVSISRIAKSGLRSYSWVE